MAVALLDGKVALVTGGARGIGLAVGARLAAHGAAVALADLAPEAVAEAAGSLEGPGGPGGLVAGVAMDVTDPVSVAAGFDEAERLVGPVDVVVANAGVLVLRPALELTAQDFRRVLEVNLTGAFVTCTEGARRMVARGGGGRVIASSSLFGVRGGVENAAYSASKFGLVGLTQCLAAELGPHGITVNAVCPGQVETPMMRELVAERSRLTGAPVDEVERALVARTALGRAASPEEVADTYVWLASDLATYVTGQSVVVDGGWLVG